jgi:hypothetical protein
MSAQQLVPTERAAENLLLAAIDRAVRHSRAGRAHTIAGSIAADLAVNPRSGEWRRVRGRLRALEVAGAVEQTRALGMAMWGLTTTGRRRLTRALRTGAVPDMPESPQHRAWREAQAAGAREIGAFHRSMRDVMREAAGLLKAESPAHSDVWFELAERLRRRAWEVGSATHCLYEWAEPSDAHADIDDRHSPGDDELPDDEQARRRYRRVGRRNTWMWGWL